MRKIRLSSVQLDMLRKMTEGWELRVVIMGRYGTYYRHRLFYRERLAKTANRLTVDNLLHRKLIQGADRWGKYILTDLGKEALDDN